MGGMHAPDFDKLTVLVADPSPHMSALIVSMLRAIKVRDAHEVNSAAGAMSLLKARRFSVIILDDALADFDGVALTRRLRAAEHNPNRDTPVIMISGAPDAERIKAARDAGVTEFLRKPFAANHVASRLNSILKAPREFIEGEAYVGPDRRRRKDGPRPAERRASAAPEGEVS